MIKRFKKFNESKSKFPDIKKNDIDGFIVFLGRDALSNDYLTFNVADDDDIWMHVKGTPGSHVVIRVHDNLPTLEVIKKAAKIAKANSKSKSLDSATIVYCKRKFVKKEANMNPGQVRVDYRNAEEIIV